MGDPIRTVAPTALPVTLAEFKAQAKIEDEVTDEDALLQAYLRAAVEEVERYARLALITQTWEQTFPVFPKKLGLTLDVKPVQAVESVEYLDAGEVSQTLDTSVYRVAGIGADKSYPKIHLGDSQSWPTVAEHPEAVRVTMTAGYGDDHNDVPELVRIAVLLTASTWHENREDLITGTIFREMPLASKALLRDWRPLAVA